MDKITNVYTGSVKYGLLERHSKECDPKLVDATVKNKWNWNWLNETDFSKHGDFLSDCIVKINKPGQAYCLYCSVPIVYGSSGKRNLRKHAKGNKFHSQQSQIRKTNTAIPVSYLEPNGKNRPHETCSLPYGAAANIHEQKLCSAGKIVQKKPAVSLVDRKCNTEAYFVSFI